MVRTNLIQVETRIDADNTWPFALGLLALILTGIFLTVPAETKVSSKALGTEEKEIVFEAINRVESSTPEMVKWSRVLRVAIENGVVTLPQTFFEIDPIAQESEIVQIMAKQILPKQDPNEIAVVGE